MDHWIMNHSNNAVIADIDRQIDSRRLLLHPFYQRWTAGQLTLAALQDYARQYYHHVAAFPAYLSAVHSNTNDLPARRQILENLMDEEAGDPNHPELWLQFAEGLGVKREDVQQAEQWPETRNLIGSFRAVCRDGSTAEGLAALYAYESQIPAVAESKIAGLKAFYEVVSERALAYFDVHIKADEEHSKIERRLLEGYVDESNAAAVKGSVAKVLDALWEMLSGVDRRYPMAA